MSVIIHPIAIFPEGTRKRMLWPLFVLIVAMLLCAFLVQFMMHVGVMDIPGHRSSHDRPIPKGGGVGIVTAFALGLPILRAAVGLPPLTSETLCLLCGTVFLAVVSWLDDMYSFPARHKLLAQAVASCLILGAAGWIGSSMWHLAIPGLIWLLYITNATNFIDGINGLASGSLMIASAVLGLVFLAHHDTASALPAVMLAACLLAFLPFNFPRASIFMGDVGSQGAGLVMGWMGLVALDTLSEPLLVPMLMSGILYDVAFTLVRRAIAGARLSQAHRSHLYQLAVRSGSSPILVTTLYWCFVVWGGIVAWSGSTTSVAIVAIMVPQIIWTVVTIHRARQLISQPW
ncbi:glycoside hydrolase [Neoasaia chiangmaiensis]|nr:glycosyltransferase family 4 protein [Neoasaia chiangmaiensis]GEN16044.1 glycoside hydrolase [Neoasaia chiangmaiensis]